MSPRVHQIGRSNPNGPPFIPSPSAFTHSSPSAFSAPQFGSLSMFGRYYDDSSSGNSSNSNASLEESDHTDNRTGDDGRAFDAHGYNTSSNGSGTTLSEYEMGSNDQISNTDPQVEEPDQESHIQESDLVPLPSSRSRTSNNPQRNFINSYVYSTTPSNVPTTPQQQQQQERQRLQQQQQQQQRFYIPADSVPNFHASRRVMSATTSAFAAAIGRESVSRHGHASTGTSTDPFSPITAMAPNLASFGFGTAVGTEARTRSERRGLGPPRREREPVHRHVETRTVPPQFRAKAVCKLDCRGCGSVVCMRGMKAMLLADTRVELFSTDCPPVSVQLVGEDYTTRNCRCKIRDVACIGCGGVCGYHITAPCGRCMEACNNGHFWMFHTDGVKSVDRLDGSGNKTLLWASLPVVENDTDGRDVYDRMCR